MLRIAFFVCALSAALLVTIPAGAAPRERHVHAHHGHKKSGNGHKDRKSKKKHGKSKKHSAKVAKFGKHGTSFKLPPKGKIVSGVSLLPKKSLKKFKTGWNQVSTSKAGLNTQVLVRNGKVVNMRVFGAAGQQLRVYRTLVGGAVGYTWYNPAVGGFTTVQWPVGTYAASLDATEGSKLASASEEDDPEGDDEGGNDEDDNDEDNENDDA